eukprot:GGOE01006033.1.p1 GENE.GGOE01006033.1~~GGOE01006033.1.p1  ORF type:complete len:328 (-),score=87.28 GGOE01006033.1:174-1157(-)
MDCVNSPEVHDEIRQLAVRERQRIVALKQPGEEGILEGLRQYGPAMGAQKMMDKEMNAALHAIESGMYVVLRSSTGEDCIRVAPSHSCFCGHTLADHNTRHRRVPCQQPQCRCDMFQYMFERPEEIGEYWLVRRKNFNLLEWAPKCRCKHGPKEHAPNGSKSCKKCACGAFESSFLCLVCDKHWEEHETVFETEMDRRLAGRTVGEAFKPLAQVAPEFSEIVFGKQNEAGVYIKAPATKAQQALTRPRSSPHPKPGPKLVASSSTPSTSTSSSAVKNIGAPRHRGLAEPEPSGAERPRSLICSGCQAAFASATAKFCPHCGTPRTSS